MFAGSLSREVPSNLIETKDLGLLFCSYLIAPTIHFYTYHLFWMSQSSRASLVGSVFERKPVLTPSAPRKNASGGFPSVQHRSKSAFQRAREDKKRAGALERPRNTPSIASVSSFKDDDSNNNPSGQIIAEATEDWRKQMEEENQRKVEEMTKEEREAERREILERFGSNVREILRRARAAREAAQIKDISSDEQTSRSRVGSKVLKSAS